MNDELTEQERATLRKFAALRTIATGIVARWSWLFVFVFFVLFAAAFWYRMQHTARSAYRFTATTRLLYAPRSVSKIQTPSEKQLLRILERRSLKLRVADAIKLPPGDADLLGATLTMTQEGRSPNIFTLTAKARSAAVAVRKVNAYAEVLIAEYGSFRAQEIARWSGAVDARERDLRDQIAAVEAEEALLKTQAGTATPIEMLTSLNSLISDQRRNLLLLDVERAAEEARRAKCEADLGHLTEAALACAPELRRISDAMAALDAELATLREIYTDLNPKVRGKLDDRAALEAEYRGILEKHGLGTIETADLERAEKASLGLVEAQTRIDAIDASRPTVAATLRENEEKADALTEFAPQLERLRARRNDLEQDLRALSEQQDEITYVGATLRSDLQVIEPAKHASGKDPLGTETFIVAAAAAAAGVGALMAWIVVIGLWLGKVRGAVELSAWGDVTVLGSLPGRWGMRKKDVKDVLGVVAMNFVNTAVPKGIVLVCRLRGATPQPNFEAALDWSLSMSGQRAFDLHIVPSGSAESDGDSGDFLNTTVKAAEGWFPVATRYSLAPTELQMLRADLAKLRQDFDCVFVDMPDGFRRGGNFFRQLLEACESVLLMVGANRTRRRELAYTRRLVLAAGKPMLGLVTGARGGLVRKELEGSKW